MKATTSVGLRTGEKLGWTVGWLGGFSWVVILSVVFLAQGKQGPGVVGLVLSGLAASSIVFFAPWRFPESAYWKLMLAPYTLFLVAVVWAIWGFGGLATGGVRWWNLLWLLPVFMPFVTIGRKKWAETSSSEDPPTSNSSP